MPLPVIAGGAVLSVIIIPLVVKVLIALGVGFVTFTGLNLLLDEAYNLIVAQISSLPTEPLSMLAIMKVDVYITMVFSAYSARMALAGLTAAGTLSKINFKGAT